jgi:hypothetical protein
MTPEQRARIKKTFYHTMISCYRKKKFRTAEHANLVAKKFDQIVYECKTCGGFHCATKRGK